MNNQNEEPKPADRQLGSSALFCQCDCGAQPAPEPASHCWWCGEELKLSETALAVVWSKSLTSLNRVNQLLRADCRAQRQWPDLRIQLVQAAFEGMCSLNPRSSESVLPDQCQSSRRPHSRQPQWRRILRQVSLPLRTVQSWLPRLFLKSQGSLNLKGQNAKTEARHE